MISNYQQAESNLGKVEQNAFGDHPRPTFIWPMLAIAAIQALLAIADQIQLTGRLISESMATAGRGN